MNNSKNTKRRWLVNILFAAVILCAAAVLWFVVRGSAAADESDGRYAFVDFGMDITEEIPLDEDRDYYYQVGRYIVHLQVKEHAIAFLDSQCPDHVCEQFGWLGEEGQWASCIPAGVYVVIRTAE